MIFNSHANMAAGYSRLGGGAFVVVGGSTADIVKEFGDLEFCGSFLFGGKFLNGLASGLKLGFLDRACHVQDDIKRHLGVQHHTDGVQAKFLDRAQQLNLLAIDRDAGRSRGFGRVTGGDRAIKRAGVGGRADDDETLTIETGGQLFGFFPGSRLRASRCAFCAS